MTQRNVLGEGNSQLNRCQNLKTRVRITNLRLAFVECTAVLRDTKTYKSCSTLNMEAVIWKVCVLRMKARKLKTTVHYSIVSWYTLGPSVVVKALRCKSVRPGIDSKRWRLEFILWSLTFPWSPGVNSVSKNEYQDIPVGKGGRCVRGDDRVSSNLGALTDQNPLGHIGPVIGVVLILEAVW